MHSIMLVGASDKAFQHVPNHMVPMEYWHYKPLVSVTASKMWDSQLVNASYHIVFATKQVGKHKKKQIIIIKTKIDRNVYIMDVVLLSFLFQRPHMPIRKWHKRERPFNFLWNGRRWLHNPTDAYHIIRCFFPYTFWLRFDMFSCMMFKEIM